MDTIDAKMVQLLRADGRMSNADLALPSACPPRRACAGCA